MLPSQESKSQSLLSAWITKCRSLLQKSGLQCVLSYHSRKTHSYKQEIMSKCTYSATHFMVGKPTAIIKPPNLWVCCTCHSHNLNSKCSLMICWQLTCSRFAFSLKSSTSPAWNTMFSLGQQNRANAAFIFHPNPNWERHGSHSKAQVLSATRLGMSFALQLCNIIQFSAGGFLVNKMAIWGIKKQHQNTKSISFLSNLQSQKSLPKKKKKKPAKK